MATAAKIYTRLTRPVAGVASYSSLWLGPDHLLLVSSTGYSESYSRIMLRDIQAFFVLRTDRRVWWNLAYGLMAGVSVLRVGFLVEQGTYPIGSAMFLALGAAGLVWNNLLGPGCAVYVVTGVRTAKLPALARQKKARRIVARLQPLIAEAQADLAPAPTAAPAEAAAPVAPPAPATSPHSAPTATPTS